MIHFELIRGKKYFLDRKWSYDTAWVVGLCAAFFLASYTCLTKIAMVNMNVPSLMSVGGPLRANEIIFFIQTSKLNNYLLLSQISLAFLLCCHASADV